MQSLRPALPAAVLGATAGDPDDAPGPVVDGNERDAKLEGFNGA